MARTVPNATAGYVLKALNKGLQTLFRESRWKKFRLHAAEFSGQVECQTCAIYFQKCFNYPGLERKSAIGPVHEFSFREQSLVLETS